MVKKAAVNGRQEAIDALYAAVASFHNEGMGIPGKVNSPEGRAVWEMWFPTGGKATSPVFEAATGLKTKIANTIYSIKGAFSRK